MSAHLCFIVVGVLDHDTKVFLPDVSNSLRVGTRVAQTIGGFRTNAQSVAFLDLVGVDWGEILPDLAPFFAGPLAPGTLTREGLEAAWDGDRMEEMLEAQQAGLDVYATLD
jgi:hypothetical protein